jgi:hypothetical protein
MSYQRSWKNSRLKKRNIRENSCLRTETLTVSKGFCENSSLGKGKNFRLNKGNIFPSRKSLVSDIPAGGRENRETFFYGVGQALDCVLCRNRGQTVASG